MPFSSLSFSTSSPWPIFKNTSSSVVTPTEYDLTFNSSRFRSRSEKKDLKKLEESVGS